MRKTGKFAQECFFPNKWNLHDRLQAGSVSCHSFSPQWEFNIDSAITFAMIPVQIEIR